MSNLILITGDDALAVKNNATKTAMEAKSSLKDEYLFEVIDGEDENAAPQKIMENLLISIGTPSFFGDAKIVWLKHFSQFKNLTGQGNTSKDLQDYFKSVTDSFEATISDNSLKLIIDGPNIDKRSAFYKFCKKNGEVFEFDKIKTNDKTYQVSLRSRIKEYCDAENVKIDNNAIEFLSEAVGSDTGRLTSEISKLVSYISDTTDTITLKHCNEICTKSIEMANWIFSEALADKDIKQSFYSLKILIDNLVSDTKTSSNPELTMFFSAVRKFQDLIKIKLAAAELGITGSISYNNFQNILAQNADKFPDNAVVGMHPYRAYMLYKQSNNFKDSDIPKIFAELINANKDFVSGTANQRILLENLIFKICT